MRVESDVMPRCPPPLAAPAVEFAFGVLTAHASPALLVCPWGGWAGRGWRPHSEIGRAEGRKP